MKPNTRPGSHLYNRGWLGLIPLVGAFAGVYLILLGSSKYKNKKLILIGSAAVLFTVVVYSSLFYYSMYSTKFRKDFSHFCQPEMNELIKSIEFYKIENGQYPDSLEEVNDEKLFSHIWDPMAQKETDNKRQYYYKKAGGKYVLFSSGVDRIPYNADDIFPSARFFDSTKTGLIKPN